MKLHFCPRLLLAVVSLLAWLSFACPAAEAQVYLSKTLYGFTNAGGDGHRPEAGLIMDGSGNLYGTTAFGGTDGLGIVFELVNSSGAYTEKILYSFTGIAGDGGSPQAGLVMDGSGNLFGTTSGSENGGYGTVFELVNSSGSYSEKVLYSFGRVEPVSGLVMDSSGNLYGTVAAGGHDGYGIVFELVNSSGSYSENTLLTFGSDGVGSLPYGGLIMDSAGNLYGTTASGGGANAGVVFELVNSSGTYSQTVLYSFAGGSDGATPLAGLVMDASGNLFGTTESGGANGDGTVFELVNSNGAYTEKTLYNFVTGYALFLPLAGLTIDGSGNLYGTTVFGGANNSGTVFELLNTSGSYSEKVLYSFSGGSDGGVPLAGLIMDASGHLYGTTSSGGTGSGGTVFELVNTNGVLVPTTLTVTSSASPAVAGQAITLTATVNAPAYNDQIAGTVTFSGPSDSVIAGVSSNAATLSLDPEALGGIGTYTITARYTPSNPGFAASSSSLSLTVNEAGVVVTNGNNTLTGTETVNGNVAASAFVGNGSGLTNVLASGLNCAFCIGNQQLAINYAASSAQGGPASNALLLGGLAPGAFQPAGSYATTGANLFTGNQSVNGSLSVSGNSATTGTTTIGPNGTPIVQHLSMTFNPSFKPLAVGCTSQSFTFAGVNDGDSVALGVPNERMTSADVVYTAWVSTAGTVTIRACTFSIRPRSFGSGAIRVDVWQH